MITKNSTLDAYNSAIKSFIGFGGTCPSKPRTILKYIEEKGAIDRDDRLRVSSLRAHVSAIRKWHLEGGYLDPTSKPAIAETLNSLESLERQNGIYSDESRFITPEEGVQLVSLLIVMNDSPKSKLDRLITAVSLMAGHRTSMIAKIRIDQMMNLGVPGTSIIINTPSLKTKAKAPTIIPFTGGHFCPATWIREQVKDLNMKSGWLFPSNINPDQHLTRQTINSTTKRTLKAANIIGGKLTSTSFRKTMATLAAMEGVNAMAIAAQGSWSSINTINKHYVSKAIALLGDAPRAVLSSIEKANIAIQSELDLLAVGSNNTLTENLALLRSFEEMRRGYWDVLFHTKLPIQEKRGFASYFKTADKQVVKYGGETLIPQFKATCDDCGFQILCK